jgi:hypothetical protein
LRLPWPLQAAPTCLTHFPQLPPLLLLLLLLLLFQAVALALGPCKQPLPAFRHAAYPFDGTYGQIGHNIELVKAFGPVSILVGSVNMVL